MWNKSSLAAGEAEGDGPSLLGEATCASPALGCRRQPRHAGGVGQTAELPVSLGVHTPNLRKSALICG